MNEASQGSRWRLPSRAPNLASLIFVLGRKSTRCKALRVANGELEHDATSLLTPFPPHVTTSTNSFYAQRIATTGVLSQSHTLWSSNTVYTGAGAGYTTSRHEPMTSSDGPDLADSPSTSSFYHTTATTATNPTSTPDGFLRSSSPLAGPSSPFSSTTATRRLASSGSISSVERAYKSRVSARHGRPTTPLNGDPSNSASSSSSSSLRLVHANSRRLARATHQSRQRDLSLGRPENPFAPGAYALGAMRNGEWEEWTGDEEKEMELEQRREIWLRRRALELQATRELGDVQEEHEEEEEEPEVDFEQEPPDDILELYDGPNLYSQTQSIPRLPSLASESGTTDGGDYFDDIEMQDTQEYDTPASLVADSKAEVDAPLAFKRFTSTLLASTCPRCRSAGTGTIQGHATEGAGCVSCGWSLSMGTLEALSMEFAAHFSAPEIQEHAPIFTWDPSTDTLVLCTECDESWAA